MLISKILTILPEKFQHFSTSWDSTPKADRTIENLMCRLIQEEDRVKAKVQEVPVSFKAETMNNNNRNKTNDKKNITCYGCGKTG